MSHLSKCLVTLLRNVIDPWYTAGVPSTQFGATRGGGTDFAHHIVLEVLHHAHVRGLSACLLFLDLVKAFDKALREIVFGLPVHVRRGEGSHYLLSLGLSDEDAELVLEYLQQHGTAMHQMHVPAEAERLTFSLHSNSWAAYGDVESYNISG